MYFVHLIEASFQTTPNTGFGRFVKWAENQIVIATSRIFTNLCFKIRHVLSPYESVSYTTPHLKAFDLKFCIEVRRCGDALEQNE